MSIYSALLDWLPLIGLAGVCLSFPLGMQVRNNTIPQPANNQSVNKGVAEFASSFNITYRNRKWNATRHAFYRSITFYVHYNLLNGVFLDNFIFFGGIYRVVAKCLT